MASSRMPADPIVRLAGVTLEREQCILQGIDWEVFPGEHWVLLGANGCGKTSLLRIITCYQLPTRERSS